MTDVARHQNGSHPSPTASTPVIAIDKDIPLPGKGGGSVAYLPFDRMEVGDSFAVPYETPQNANALRGAAVSLGKRKKKKFAGRVRVELDLKVIRFWRTA